MKTDTLLSCFCLYIFLWMPSLCDVCPYQECRCMYSSIYCDDKTMHSIPVLNNWNLFTFTELTFDGNQITTIPYGSLPTNLTQLAVQNNPLTSIDDDALNTSARTLNSLIFSKPLFTRIPNALLCLQNLKQLNVEAAGILDWNVDVMKQIGLTLTVLYLENVTFTSPPTWLQYLSHLIGLNIVSSNLNSLPDNILDNMTDTVITVSLSSNRFTEIPKAILNLKSLKLLDLSNNKIVSTKWLPISKHTMVVNLNGNLIYNSSELSSSLRQYADSLVTLNIEDNQLVSIPDFSFFNGFKSLSLKDNRISDYSSGALPPNFLALDLENNLLRTIPVGLPGLEILEAIVLKSNIISHIQGTDFPPRVQTVELANNFITTLNDDSFPETSMISSLNLNYNPISKISLIAFKNLGLLKELSLQGTKITRLPLALISLSDLRSLDVSDTAGLVCTCEEKELAVLMLSNKLVSVLGNCGNIKVFDFFYLLSPGCPTK